MLAHIHPTKERTKRGARSQNTRPDVVNGPRLSLYYVMDCFGASQALSDSGFRQNKMPWPLKILNFDFKFTWGEPLRGTRASCLEKRARSSNALGTVSIYLIDRQPLDRLISRLGFLETPLALSHRLRTRSRRSIKAHSPPQIHRTIRSVMPSGIFFFLSAFELK